ncbi:MAG: hypothetical protein NVS9B2_30600 [Steroidobacteraceae bacterium]
MPRIHVFGEYISRKSVYVLFDGARCLYLGDSRVGRAGVASRVTQHLTNAAKPKDRAGRLHTELNSITQPENWYLGWRLEIYSVAECGQKTGKILHTVEAAQEAMIALLEPVCNVQKR